MYRAFLVFHVKRSTVDVLKGSMFHVKRSAVDMLNYSMFHVKQA